MTRKTIDDAVRRVASWPAWKQDAADRWVAQLKEDNEIERANLRGWGPFDQ